MRLTDLSLYALLGLFLYGVYDLDAALNLLAHISNQLRAVLSWAFPFWS